MVTHPRRFSFLSTLKWCHTGSDSCDSTPGDPAPHPIGSGGPGATQRCQDIAPSLRGQAEVDSGFRIQDSGEGREGEQIPPRSRMEGLRWEPHCCPGLPASAN